MRCIYCKEPFASPPPDEHVFPHAFGCPDTFVLDCVCNSCNSTLNSSIDQHLIKDSVEATLRNKLMTPRLRSRKHRKREEKKGKSTYRPRRRKFSVIGETYGRYQECIMDTNPDDPATLVLVPQLVLTDEKGNRHHFTKSMLERSETREQAMKLPRNRWEVFAEKADSEEFMRWLLEEGIMNSMVPEGFDDPPEGAFRNDALAYARIHAEVDATIQRALVKIAFNYLAKTRGWEVALDPAFDEVRHFITTGEGGSFIKFMADPHIDSKLMPGSQFYHGFQIRYDWPERYCVRARIVLFSELGYQIKLSNNFRGIVCGSGHVYESDNPLEMKTIV